MDECVVLQGSLLESTGDAERLRRDDERRLQEIQQQLQLLEENEPGGVSVCVCVCERESVCVCVCVCV